MGWEDENETADVVSDGDAEWLDTPVALSAPEGYDSLTEEGKKQIQELIKILPKKDGK